MTSAEPKGVESQSLRFLEHARGELASIRSNGLYKNERVIASPQGAVIVVRPDLKVINFAANNYLGLSDHPDVLAAAHAALDRRGYGMSSVRFISGTQDVHKDLERALSHFLATDDTILYGSCFDANCGLFEALLGEEDAVVSDDLNHASIIDGIRLSKAKRFRYANNDMDDLERQLKGSAGSRFTLIATDGVFSMDGTVANLGRICDLADHYRALVMVDDSHAVGIMGAHGRGSHEARGVMGRIDIITGTLGKALGGASGGYTSGRKEIVELLRQRSRPYLFSNSVAPVIAATSVAVLSLLEHARDLRDSLFANTRRFRLGMSTIGFQIAAGEHPIVPIMLGDARLAATMAERLLADGVYVVAFSYPVVPRDQARIRVQLSAAHTAEHIDHAIASFARIGRDLGVI